MRIASRPGPSRATKSTLAPSAPKRGWWRRAAPESATGTHSTRSQIFHTAIYVGNGWFIQSSDEGVALAQLTGYYRQKFAWGRRPLREAGLEH